MAMLVSCSPSPLPPLLPSLPPSPPTMVSSLPSICSSATKPLHLRAHSQPPAAASQPPVHVYPDPIPAFAQAETQKFRTELAKKLNKNRDVFGRDMDVVVQVCAEIDVRVDEYKMEPVPSHRRQQVTDYMMQIFSEFLHKEYGGPETLMVEPFTDMLLALKEKKLPGAPVAARAALLWAQNNVDRDWEIWTSQPSK